MFKLYMSMTSKRLKLYYTSHEYWIIQVVFDHNHMIMCKSIVVASIPDTSLYSMVAVFSSIVTPLAVELLSLTDVDMLN